MTRWRIWRRAPRPPSGWLADASAYLDDELTANERSRFESALERSPELREQISEIALIQSQLSVLREAHPSRSFELHEADIAPQSPRLIALKRRSEPLRIRFAAAAAAASIAALTAVVAWDALDSGDAAPTAERSAAESTSIAPSLAESAPVKQQQAAALETAVSAFNAEGAAEEAQATDESAAAPAADQSKEIAPAAATKEMEAQQQAGSTHFDAEDAEAEQAAIEDTSAEPSQATANPARQAVTANAGGSDIDLMEGEATPTEVQGSAAPGQTREAAADELPTPESAAPEPQTAGERSATGERGERRALSATQQSEPPAADPPPIRVRRIEEPHAPEAAAPERSWETPLEIALLIVAAAALTIFAVQTIRRRT